MALKDLIIDLLPLNIPARRPSRAGQQTNRKNNLLFIFFIYSFSSLLKENQ